MLASMKALLVLSLFIAVPALADAPHAVKVAKGPVAAKKKGPTSPKEKVIPEGARTDPRESAAPAAAPAAPSSPGDIARHGMARIEFDDRLVQGQTNKANAIYLFERRESALRSLLKKRADFHDEIDETLE